MAICETCDYANRPPYKSPCSECDKTMGSPFCRYEHEEKPTNADRIRYMTDEELVVFLDEFSSRCIDCVEDAKNQSCPIYKEGYYCRPQDIMGWLKQPAE